MQYYTEYLVKEESKLMMQYGISNERVKRAFEELRFGLHKMSLVLLKLKSGFLYGSRCILKTNKAE